MSRPATPHALIENRAADAAVRADPRLQFDEAADVAAKAGQVIERDAVDGITDRGVHGLKFIADGGNLDHDIRSAHLQSQVHVQSESNLHYLMVSLHR